MARWGIKSLQMSKGLRIFICVSFILILSSNAYAVRDVGPLKAMVSVTSKEIIDKTEQRDIDLNIPVINGMRNSDFQDKLNSMFEEKVIKFAEDIQDFAKEDEEYAKEHNFPFIGYAAYTRFEVTYIEDDLISLYITYYSYTGGAHGMTYREYYNIDLKSETLLELKDLFDIAADYKTLINQEIRKQMEKEPERYFKEFLSTASISDNHSYYFTDGGIVIYFDLYEIAPYASGIPEFEIPFSLLEAIMR